MKYSCPHCQQRLEFQERQESLQIACPTCQRPLILPAAATASSTVTGAPVMEAGIPAASSPLTNQETDMGSKDLHRWLLLALILLAGFVVYLSRQQLGILSPVLRQEFGFSNIEYAKVSGAFLVPYIIGSLLMGVLCCLIGTRWIYGIVLVGGLMATLITGFAGGLLMLIVGRIVLGLASGGALPAAMQAVSECVPRKLQAIAVAMVLYGTLNAAFVGPGVVSAMTVQSGWRSVFFVTAGVLFVLFLLWSGLLLWAWRRPCLSSVRTETMFEGFCALGKLRSWLYVLAHLLIAPLNYLLVFWVPHFMQRTFAVALTDLSQFAVVISAAGIGGALVGALASDIPALSGFRLAALRSIVIPVSGILLLLASLGMAIASKPMMFITFAALATAAYQALLVNLYACIAGAVSPRGVGLVVGIGVMCASIMGWVLSFVVGSLHDYFGMTPLFVLMGISAFLGTIPAFFVARSLRFAEKNDL